nr:flavodoxin [Clostridia bacterium]
MIIYFTGTGNSRHLAKKVGEAINEIPVNSFEYIKECKKGSFDSDTPYVFVCPTYAWQIPHIFEKLIRESVFHGSDKAYFIMDCGGEI